MVSIQSAAEEMADTHATRLGAIPAVLLPVFVSLLVDAVKCWFSGSSSGAVESGRRLLADQHDGVTDRPAFVRRSEKHVRRVFRAHGQEPAEAVVAEIAEDLRRRGRTADKAALSAACRRAWE